MSVGASFAEQLREDIAEAIDVAALDALDMDTKRDRAEVTQQVLDGIIPKLDALLSCHFCGAEFNPRVCPVGCDE